MAELQVDVKSKAFVEYLKKKRGRQRGLSIFHRNLKKAMEKTNREFAVSSLAFRKQRGMTETTTCDSRKFGY